MQATTRCAPDSCAIAASEDTPYTGSARATAKPCASPHAIRRPVNDPGPAPYATASSAVGPMDGPSSPLNFVGLSSGASANPALLSAQFAVWALRIVFRRLFDLYVNLRPVRLFEGMPCPLAGRKPGDIDYVVIRENTEGEYGNVGGRVYEGTDREIVMQQAVFSRKGTDRILKYAFELARTRKKHVTSATKSNGISI